MIRDEVWNIVKDTAPRYGLDCYLVMAVIEQESNYDEEATRLENGYKGMLDRAQKRQKYPEHDEVVDVLLSTSWGLMQTMGDSLLQMSFFGMIDPMSVAQALSYYLSEPKEQIEFGCKWLKWKIGLAKGDIRQGLLYWNGGGNQNYDDEVFERLEKIKTLYKG